MVSVAEDFRAFRAAYLIAAETVGTIGQRYRRITRQLNRDFWTTDSETAHSLYVGSYGRDTAARGVSDLDIAFELPAAIYHKYHAYQTNGQSALLQAVRVSLQKTYSTSGIGGDGQVVGVSFQDGIRFEVLPVFTNTAGGYNFADSNGGGSWKTCNPRAEMAAFAAENAAANGNLKALARMMRIWKRQHGVPISGMLIDTLAHAFIRTWGHRDKSFLYHDYLVRDFLLYLSRLDVNQSYWRAPGSDSYVYKTGSFQRRAAASYADALRAIEHGTNGRDWSYHQAWRAVFGPLFP